MQLENGQSSSIWAASASMPSYAPLTRDTQSDVCIVGAGMAGLSTAYQLARAGRKVLVVDDGQPGGGESGRTTAQLTCILDRGYAETEELRGEADSRLAAASHMAAIDEIERIVQEEQIDCDFARMDGYYFLAPDDELQTLRDEFEAARRAGLAVELIDRIPQLGFDSGPALRFPRQGHFHILRYLQGLARAIEHMGGTIASGTRVTKVRGGHPVQLETERGLRITANAVVLATNAPINDVLGYSSRVFPYRTYVIGVRVPRGSVGTAIYFDTEEPYHYLRLQPEDGYDVLLVGGEDHKTGQSDDPTAAYDELERWTRERFPMAGETLYRWSGQVLNSLDGLALLGRDIVDEHVYIITADNGMGMTHTTIGSMVVRDLILGRANPWAELYTPMRLPPRSLGDVVQEGLNVAAQLREWVTGGEVRSVSQIPRGSGAVMGFGLSKVAVYCDEQGAVHRYSAVCPHLGCIVGWNDAEKTWDCPCHGSRFNAHGTVINGPAASNLEPAQ